MKFIRNGHLERELYARLEAKYHKPRPETPHLSELLYCLTRSYYDRFQPLAPSDAEMLYFSVGFGLESVLLRDEHTFAPEVQQLDSVYMTLDYVSLEGSGVDLKTTRMMPNKDGSGVPTTDWPGTWLKQFMAYAKLLGSADYTVAVLYLGGRGAQPELVVGTFSWTQEEIDANWAYVQNRKAVYMAHIEGQRVPQPFAYNEEWECRTCRYLLRCQAAAGGAP